MIDENGDREPEYWLWGLGPGMNESEPFGLIPVKDDTQRQVCSLKECIDRNDCQDNVIYIQVYYGCGAWQIWHGYIGIVHINSLNIQLTLRSVMLEFNVK